MSLAPDALVHGRYRIVRAMERGGFGAIYEAIDEVLSRRVAVKQLLHSNERIVRQFQREAKLLANLSHPSLPRVTDYFTQDNGVFLVMDFVPGEDLGAMLLRRTAPFPVADVLRWATQLVDALDYIHTNDPPIIHRDIKPPNLKLQANGRIMLLDFGLAKGSAGEVRPSSSESSIMGYTRGFAPPEQVEGRGTDARSDIYGMAATLYCLLTNVAPAEAQMRLLAESRQRPDPVLPAHTLNPAVPLALSDLLEQGLRLEPDDRIANARAFGAALRWIEANTPQATIVDSAPPTEIDMGGASNAASRRPSSDPRPRPSSDPVRPSSNPRAATPISDPVRPPSDPRAVAAPAPSSNRTLLVVGGALLVLLLFVGIAAGLYITFGRDRTVAGTTVRPEQPVVTNGPTIPAEAAGTTAGGAPTATAPAPTDEPTPTTEAIAIAPTDEPTAEPTIEPTAEPTTTPTIEPTTTPEPTATSVPQPLRPVRVDAATYAPQGVDACGTTNTYEPAKAVDGQTSTAWRVDGAVQNPWIELGFGAPVVITRVGIVPGFDKVDACDGTDRFTQGRVVRKVRLEFDNNVAYEVDLSRDRRIQFADLPTGITSQRMRVWIVSSDEPPASGGRNLLALSEVEVWGTPGN